MTEPAPDPHPPVEGPPAPDGEPVPETPDASEREPASEIEAGPDLETTGEPETSGGTAAPDPEPAVETPEAEPPVDRHAEANAHMLAAFPPAEPGLVPRPTLAEAQAGATEPLSSQHGVQVGSVVAEVQVEDETVELSIEPLRFPPTHQEWTGLPGSVGRDWVRIGFQIIATRKGRRRSRFDLRQFHSIFAALEALAENEELPDEALLNSRLLELRQSRRSAADEEPPPAQQDDAVS